jgi:hypothetical protein
MPETNFESTLGRAAESSAEKRESKEVKEAEVDPELKAAATLERADYLVKEVKSGKQQMQNIVLHMQQVKQAIKKIRQQLQLVTNGDDDDRSVTQDEAQVEKLKKQITEYSKEIHAMKDDLVAAQITELQKTNPSAPQTELQTQALQMVEDLIGETQEL